MSDIIITSTSSTPLGGRIKQRRQGNGSPDSPVGQELQPPLVNPIPKASGVGVIENFKSIYPNGMIRHIKHGGEIVGNDCIQPGDFVAIFDGCSGKLRCSRARYDRSLDHIHYFTTADKRNKEISYDDKKGPLLLVRLEADASGGINHEGSSIRLLPNTTSQLLPEASYLLTAEHPDVNLCGKYLGTINVEEGLVPICCFSSICFDMQRSKKVYAAPINVEGFGTSDELHGMLESHGITFNEDADTHIVNGVVRLGVPIENQVGNRVQVIRLSSIYEPKNWSQFNSIVIYSVGNNKITYSGSAGFTELKRESVAIICLSKSIHPPNESLFTPNAEELNSLLEKEGITFYNDYDTYLVNGDLIGGIPIRDQILENVVVLSFSEDGCNFKTNPNHLTGISAQSELQFEEYEGNVPTRNRAIAIIRCLPNRLRFNNK